MTRRLGSGSLVIATHNAGKLNAIDIVMWHELRQVFAQIQALPADQAPAVVVICVITLGVTAII